MASRTTTTTTTAKTTKMMTEIANPVFPIKLHSLLSQAEQQGYSDVVSWLSDGKAFKVYDKSKFEATILSNVFGTSKYRSFQKNLNMWGFKSLRKPTISTMMTVVQRGEKGRGNERITATTNTNANSFTMGAYFHPFFVRDSPLLCHSIVRRRTFSSSAVAAASMSSSTTTHKRAAQLSLQLQQEDLLDEAQSITSGENNDAGLAAREEEEDWNGQQQPRRSAIEALSSSFVRRRNGGDQADHNPCIENSTRSHSQTRGLLNNRSVAAMSPTIEQLQDALLLIPPAARISLLRPPLLVSHTASSSTTATTTAIAGNYNYRHGSTTTTSSQTTDSPSSMGEGGGGGLPPNDLASWIRAAAAAVATSTTPGGAILQSPPSSILSIPYLPTNIAAVARGTTGVDTPTTASIGSDLLLGSGRSGGHQHHHQQQEQHHNDYVNRMALQILQLEKQEQDQQQQQQNEILERLQVNEFLFRQKVLLDKIIVEQSKRISIAASLHQRGHGEAAGGGQLVDATTTTLYPERGRR